MRRTLTLAAAATERVKQYHLRAVGIGVKCTTRTGSGHQVITDVPHASGGTDSAAEPVYHLLAALVGCETATATFVARKMKLNLKEMKFEIAAFRDEQGALSLPIEQDPEVPAAIQAVTGICVVDAPGITDEELTVLAKQTHLRCPVASMMTLAGTDINIEYQKAVTLDAPPSETMF